MNLKKITYMVGICTVIMAVQLMCCLLFFNNPLYNESVYLFGHDFFTFWQAAEILSENPQELYSLIRYVTPPLPAVLFLPYSAIDFNTAAIINSIILTAGIMLSLFLGFSAYRLKPLWTDFSVICIFCLSSFSFYMLFSRGNIDWIMCLCISAALLADNKRNPILAGILIGMSVYIKLYSVILFLPLLLKKRNHLIISSVMTIIIQFGCFYSLSLQYVQNRLMLRSDIFSFTENGSLVSMLYETEALFVLRADILFDELKLWSLALYFVLFSISCIAVCFYGKSSLKHIIPVYIPFMILVPNTVYLYEYVNLFLMIPFYYSLWRKLRFAAVSGFILICSANIAYEFWVVRYSLCWLRIIPPLSIILIIFLNLYILYSRKS